VSHRPEPEDEFHGVPEATFATMADLELFQSYSHLQMEDGINFLQEMIAYSSLGPNSATVVDKLDEAAPDGHDGLLRHLVFLRRRGDVPVAALRRFVTDTLMPAYASSPEILKLRRHLFEEVEVTLDHPGVAMSKPLDHQYQAALEVVVADEDALTRFAASPAWTGTVEGVAAHCEAVHAARVDRCITTNVDPGLAGVAAVEVFRALLFDEHDAVAVDERGRPSGSPAR
jgi:hypothetical protein